jgi:hypothetical protein
MRVAGGAEEIALSGWDGGGADGPVFVLGEGRGQRTEGGAAPADVVFLERGRGADGARVVAPAGDGLWRRAPWPVRDDLFDMEPAADPRRVLVVGDGGDVAERLRAIGAAVEQRPRLDVDSLRTAAVVVLLGGHGALAAQAMCVLAARRVLVSDATEVTFGLQPGIEFLRAGFADEAVERANMAAVHPDAMASLRAYGARAAREHRASIVYPRLAADLAASA